MGWLVTACERSVQSWLGESGALCDGHLEGCAMTNLIIFLKNLFRSREPAYIQDALLRDIGVLRAAVLFE
jgi:hypothetical protein